MKRLIRLWVLRSLSAAFFATLFVGLVGCKKESKTITLQLFHYKQEIVNQMNEIASVFHQKYPNITVETETIPNDAQTVLKTRLVAGESPDIMMLQSYSTVFEYAEAGYLLDISNEPFMANIVDGSKTAVTNKGKIYALPMDMAGIGVIYNKDLFKQYNLSVPTTFTEMKKVCETFEKNGIIPFAVSIKDSWPLGHFYSMAHTVSVKDELLSWVDSMNKGEAEFKSDKMDAMFKVFDFYKANGGANATEMDYNNQTANFASGKYAMMVQGLWAYGTSKSINPTLNAGFFPFPFTDDAADTKLYTDTDSTFAISSKSSPEKIDAAKKFLEFLASQEGSKMWVEKCKLIPTVKGADVSNMDSPFQDLVRYIQEGNTIPWAFSMWPVVAFEESKKAMQEYYGKQKNADQVMEYLTTQWRTAKGIK
ncbi:MAG TPA: extracellular solute-binding protein [Spirochaetota bacterium]|nr:extracellular solute-binding protein [Spirochaetota bacterium]